MLGKVKNFFCNWFNFGNQTQGLKRERELSSDEQVGDLPLQANNAPITKRLKLMTVDPSDRENSIGGMSQTGLPSKKNLEANDKHQLQFKKSYASLTFKPMGTPKPEDVPTSKAHTTSSSNMPENKNTGSKKSMLLQPLPSSCINNAHSVEAGSSLSQLEKLMAEKLGGSSVGIKPKTGLFQLEDTSLHQNRQSKSPANNFTGRNANANFTTASNHSGNPFRLSSRHDIKNNLSSEGVKKINYRPVLQKLYGSPKRRKEKSQMMSIFDKRHQRLAIQNCVRMEEKLSYKALLCQFGTKTGPFPRFSTSTSSSISPAGSSTNFLEKLDVKEPIQQSIRKSGIVIELDSDNSIQEKSSIVATVQSPVNPVLRINSLEDALAQSPQYDCHFISDIKSRYSAKERERQRLLAEEATRSKVLAENREGWEKELEQRLRKQLEIVTRPVIDERIEEVVVLPEISDEMTRIIEEALNSHRDGDVLCDAFNLTITRRDLKTLDGLNWLNDQIINFYLTMVMERSNSSADWPKVFSFNTFFYPKLMTAGHAGLKRWTRKVDLFDKDFILIPVHLGLHWCLATVCPKERAIRYYDSMGGRNIECLNSLKRYMEAESIDKKKTPLDTSDWTLECVKDIPQQMNGSDCGMFACKYAEYLSRKAKITFDQKDMPYFRRRMVYEIITQKLSHP